MTCLTRLFKKKQVPKIEHPDGSYIEGVLREAKIANSRVTKEFAIASIRHKRNAIEARTVVGNVLQRANGMKEPPNADAKK